MARLQLPSCLYGDAVTTRAAWQAQLKRVNRDFMSWVALIETIELRNVHSQLGAVVLNDDMGLSARRQLHWRLLWIPQGFRWYFSPAEANEYSVALQRQMILAGMNKPWFAISMLDPELLAPAFCRNEGFEDFARQMLRLYIVWLPEILELTRRYAYGTTALWPYLDDLNPEYKSRIWTHILDLLGYWRSHVVAEEIRHMTQSSDPESVIQVLEERRLIERVGQRFRLVE
jgi:hypothetical protein